MALRCLGRFGLGARRSCAVGWPAGQGRRQALEGRAFGGRYAMRVWSRRRPGLDPVATPGMAGAILADAVNREPRGEVDVALVLAVDASGSVSEQRLGMQLQGYQDALRHPTLIEAVRGGRHGRIALTFVE